MVKKIFNYLVIFSVFNQSLQNINDNTIDIQESNPYNEILSDIKSEQNNKNVGNLIKTIMDNGGTDLLGNFVSQLGKDNGGQILQGLSSLFSSQHKNKESGLKSPDLLQSIQSLGSIATLMSNLQGLQGKEQHKKDNTAALLNGIGVISKLLKNVGQDNKDVDKNDGTAGILQDLGSIFGEDNELSQGAASLLDGIGSILNTAGQSVKEEKSPELDNLINEDESKKEINENVLESPKKNVKPRTESEINWDNILSMASLFFTSNDQKGEKLNENNLLTYLPLMLQSIKAFVGPQAESRAKSHEGHSSLMPPVLEKAHVMFDHFIHSEIGQHIIASLGAEKSFKVFLDKKGRFNLKKFGEMMENHSYRRQWIRVVTDRIAEFLQYASKPAVYKSYLSGVQFFFNSYIKSQGFPKSTIFDPAKPVETISAFVDHVSKKYFDIKINSKEYVKPAVNYIKELIKLTEEKGTLKSFGNSNEFSSKLADTINLEIIEPLARVNRAFRYSKSYPKCERYVLCLINEDYQNESESLPGLKKLLYKGSSLLAGWFLSTHTGTPFWTLYTDIMENTNCKRLYRAECEGFFAEELKVTTEYVHSEL
uniref:Seminal fluid protein n=1 Tax=Ophraella communa TaxID=38162 RepID=A0A7M4CBG5_9CUCU|nr:seminal fluid protein [Ophraella communa]